ncbi:MAG: choice-of-anchor L domain-containing protein [Crocinitomicaceae bacterium]|nr:choice-of-anchor L domain-containing protein [Crocinitomicaceae bacterium]
MNKFVVILLALCCSLFGGNIFAQLTTSTGQTPSQLVQNVLVGNGVSATNITYTGSANAIGSFNGSATNIGLSSGIVITTGTVLNDGNGPHGPNNTGSAGTDNGIGGNSLLDNIAGNTTFNAAILEFDFVPQSDSIKFRYVFGSEEYPEYVCADFNDVFAFFISGPNPLGGNYSNQNIALLPGTSTPITIDNVNNGSVGSSGNASNCSSSGLSNSAYYVDNTNGPTIQYDGFTIPIEASAKVQCGATYHLVMAIADVGDGVWDSGIFLEANSLQSFAPIQMTSSLALDGFNNGITMAEGCETATITVTRHASQAGSALSIPVIISGTATEGVDYSNIPNTIDFAPGQTQVVFTIEAFLDALTEGTESLIIQLDQPDPCGNSNLITLPLEIKDIDPLVVTVADVSVHCPSDDVDLTAVVTGGLPNYTFNWSSGGTAETITVNPASTTTYTVTVNDACIGTPVDATGTVNVPIYPPLLMITSPDTSVLCPNTPQTLFAEATGGEGTYTYSWYEGSTFLGTGTSVGVSPMVTTTYTIVITDGCGTEISHDITITVQASVLQLTMSPDQLICPGDTAEIWVEATQGLGNYTYYWHHSGETTSDVFVHPMNTTTYTVSVEDDCHTYHIDGVTTVQVVRPTANFEILTDEPMEDLLVSFQNTSSGSVSWYWDFGNGLNSTANSPNTKYNPWGYYDVTLIAYNEIGCSDTIVKQIYVKPEYYFYAPNAFTPNGNRQNEFYSVSVIGAVAFEFQIFNRWGELIYQTTDQYFQWDGTYMNYKAQDGVYVWKAKVVDRELQYHTYEGFVTILR